MSTSTHRGEGWVIVQIILLALIFFAPADSLPASGLLRSLGLLLGGIGLTFILLSSVNLGPNLTIFPRPKSDGTLIQSGLYAIVRHPIYAGVILSAFGWALFRLSLVALILSVILLIFFDRKAHQEEQWLREKFPDYVNYQQRVKKLIPWLY